MISSSIYSFRGNRIYLFLKVFTKSSTDSPFISIFQTLLFFNGSPNNLLQPQFLDLLFPRSYATNSMIQFSKAVRHDVLEVERFNKGVICNQGQS